jgi:hypothetical protein
MRQECKPFKDEEKRKGWGRKMIKDDNKASDLQVFLLNKTDKYIKRAGSLRE